MRAWHLAKLIAGAVLGSAVLGSAAPVGAQELPTAVLLSTHAGDGVDAGAARGFDRVLRQRVAALGVVAIEAGVELDIDDVQLALGCMGESEDCLRAVAGQVGASILVFASIEASGDARVVSVQRFDARDGSLRRAVRTVHEPEAVFAAAEPIVRELWDLPAAAPTSDVPDTAPRPVVPDTAPPSPPSLGPLPAILIGVGGAALVGGAIALGIAAADHDAYRSQPRPSTQAEAEALDASFSRLESEYLAGTILVATGGAVATAGISWMLAAGREDGTSPLVIVPLMSPDGAWLVVAGALPGDAL